ncbi:MAG: transcription termination factor NusA [Pseudomonadota bacterium]
MLNIGNAEILQIAEAVSREKGIGRDLIISAMEQAIQTAGRKKYGIDHNIKAEISKKTGEVKLYRLFEVVEIAEDYFTQISLADAKEKDEDAKLGGFISELLPPIDLGRVAAQTAKQVIVQRVREAEREKQYEDFKDRAGEILSGVVKRVEFGNVIVDLGRAEALMKRDQSIKQETFKPGDRIKAYVQEVIKDTKGPQILLSRTDDRMLAKLFELEVPEIYEGTIEIRAVARDPGSKAKMIVYSSDSSIDPVGSCVGMRGTRVKSITAELAGERVDIIAWHRDPAQLIINALAPAEIAKVVIDEDKRRVEVILPVDQLSIAIGRRGQNVRLAAKLTGWNIDVLTEDQASKRRVDEFNTSSALFTEALDVDEVLGQLLTVEGFTSVEQIATADISALQSIEGFDEELSSELKTRAISYVDTKNEAIITKLEELGVEQNLIDALDVGPESLLKLAEYGVKTVEDLGELSLEEFKALAPNSNMNDDEIKNLISSARNISE